MKYEPDKTLRLARAVISWAFAALAVTFFAFAAAAQDTNDDYDFLTPEELEELVGPIALYPDDLIGIVLPAATFPLQIVEASRFLDLRENDPNAAPDDDWDDSVVALLNYPEVVHFLNDDLDWTWSLGEAVLNQRADVLDAVQRFRGRALAAGNLRSDDRQVVAVNQEAIEIRHAQPEVIYVPYYEPRQVIVYQSAPVIHYHPWSYPVYYYPYPVGHHFDAGFFFGVTSAFVIGWHDHFFHVHHHHHHLHPYFGYYYYDPFYVRRSVSINVNIYRDSYVWEPRVRTVGRPVRFSDGRPVTRTVERRVNDGGATRTVRNDSGRTTRTIERQASTTGSTTTRSTTTAGTRTRTTEGGATAGATRSSTTERNTAAATRATERAAGVGGGARPSTNGTTGGANVRNAPAAPSASQQRTRIVEGRPSQGSSVTTQRTAPSQPSTSRSPTVTQRPTTTQRPTVTTRPQSGTSAPPPSSNARTQTSQPSAPSSSAQSAPRPSAPPSSSSSSSSSSSRTRSDAGNSGSSRSQSGGSQSSSSSGSSRSQSSGGGSSSSSRTR